MDIDKPRCSVLEDDKGPRDTEFAAFQAGGRIGTLTGSEYRQGGNVIAGTPKVYEALVAALGPLVPEPLREA